MAQKPNYVTITITCGRCRETIVFPSECTKGLVSLLMRQINSAYAADILSDVSFNGNRIGLEQFNAKFDYLYVNEE